MAIIRDEMSKVGLTNQISELLVYMADLERGYTDRTVQNEISKFTGEIGKTKDELKALVSSLDGLDFKEDGKIDPKGIVTKVAQIEALINVNKGSLEGVRGQLTEMAGKVSEVDTKAAAQVSAVQSKLSEVIANINNMSEAVKVASTLSPKVTALESKYTDLESKFKAQDQKIGDTKIDVTSIKKQLSEKLGK